MLSTNSTLVSGRSVKAGCQAPVRLAEAGAHKAGTESPHRQEQDPPRHWLLRKRSSKGSTKGLLSSCQPPAPSNHTPGVGFFQRVGGPCPASLGATLGHWSGPQSGILTLAFCFSAWSWASMSSGLVYCRPGLRGLPFSLL